MIEPARARKILARRAAYYWSIISRFDEAVDSHELDVVLVPPNADQVVIADLHDPDAPRRHNMPEESAAPVMDGVCAVAHRGTRLEDPQIAEAVSGHAAERRPGPREIGSGDLPLNERLRSRTFSRRQRLQSASLTLGPLPAHRFRDGNRRDGAP